MSGNNKPFPFEAVSALLLRVGLGVLFFFAGVNKIAGGPVAAAQGMIGNFEETYLPVILVAPFAYVLPYIEVLLGAALIVGIFTKPMLTVAGILLIMLSLGTNVMGNPPTTANNINYILVTVAALYFVCRDNRWSIDGYRGKA